MQSRTGPLFAAGIAGGITGFIFALIFQQWMAGLLAGTSNYAFDRLSMIVILITTLLTGAPAALLLLRLFDRWAAALAARQRRERRAFEVIPLAGATQLPQPILPVQPLEVPSDAAGQADQPPQISSDPSTASQGERI